MESDHPRLYINLAAELDWLIAVEFGRVDEGQPSENWAGVSDDFGYLHDGHRDSARAIGFKVLNFAAFDAEDDEVEVIWESPLFDAPQIGLAAASAGEIVVAAKSLYGSAQPSLNRFLFDDAAGKSGLEAVRAWTACLQAGDSMAHFGLGYTLFELGRFHESYRHLRYYTRIAPATPWSHCWYGQAAAALGEVSEARAAYTRAIELTEAGNEATDAPKLLAELGS